MSLTEPVNVLSVMWVTKMNFNDYTIQNLCKNNTILKYYSISLTKCNYLIIIIKFI